MKTRRARVIVRVSAVLSTLASSVIGFVFVVMAGGWGPLQRFLLLIPILSAPVLVALLLWQGARPGSRTQETRMALREDGMAPRPIPRAGLVEEERTILLVKQKRSRRQ